MLERLLLRLVPPDWGESIAGDLHEARARRRARGQRAGSWWGVRYCASIVFRLLVERMRAELLDARRDGGRMTMMNSVGFELKQAVRTLARTRSTSAAAIVILAVTIGFSTAVFTVADRVLFRPLPYPAAERLVELRFTTSGMRGAGISLTGEELASARGASAVFEHAEAFNLSSSAARMDGREPERLRVARVTPGFLPMLGARIQGEDFTPAHTLGAGAPVVILTHRYWTTRMGGDPGVINTLIQLDGEPPVRVIGVLDAGFVFPTDSQALLPHILRPLPDTWLEGHGRRASVIGRLRPNVPLTAVSAAVRVDSAIPSPEGMRITAIPLQERLAYRSRRGLTMLFAGVLALLFIGTLDVAGLLLVHATGRDREIVTRRAIGATGGQIARQLLLEAVLLAAAGGALGLAAARLTFGSLLQLVPEQFRLLQPTAVDSRAMLFALVVVGVTAVAFGMAPLAHLRRLSASPLRAAQGQTRPRSMRRLSNAIVASQVAAAAALLLVGTLLVSSFLRVRSAPTGFDTSHLAFISVTPPPSMASTRGDVYAAALERLSGIEGVVSAALVDVPALRQTVRGTSLSPEGRRVPDSSRLVSDTQLVVTPGYFTTAGLHLVEGRLFTEQDSANAADLAIVNETLARTWFPNESALGRRLVNGVENRVIIGVVEDARHFSLREEPLAEIFLPANPTRPMFAATFVLRAENPRAILTPAVAALRALAPTLPITQVETGEMAVSHAAEAERFYATLLAVSAAAGLALAATGLYGVLSWSVRSRRREFGLRSALGADSFRLAANVAREAVPIVASGLVLGGLLGWWCARLAASLLYEVTPGDPAPWLAAGGIIVITAAVALALPCRRAFRTNPAEALRQEV